MADTGFVFPDERFWEDFKARKVLGREQPGYDRIEQIGLGEVGRAYRSLFGILALRFSTHGSKGIIETEVAEMVPRFRAVESGHPGASESMAPSRKDDEFAGLDVCALPSARTSASSGPGTSRDARSSDSGQEQGEISSVHTMQIVQVFYC